MRCENGDCQNAARFVLAAPGAENIPGSHFTATHNLLAAADDFEERIAALEAALFSDRWALLNADAEQVRQACREGGNDGSC